MGRLNLPANSLVYLDTVTIIYSVERFPEYVTLLDPMWQQLRSGTIQIIISELALLETLVLPIRQSNADLIRRYETLLLSSEVNLMPITPSILKSAATLRAQNNRKTPDAIHASTALSAGCSAFITNDLGFRRVSNLPALILKDFVNP
jgi:predicted nucleic acid-binding protein